MAHVRCCDASRSSLDAAHLDLILDDEEAKNAFQKLWRYWDAIASQYFACTSPAVSVVVLTCDNLNHETDRKQLQRAIDQLNKALLIV